MAGHSEPFLGESESPATAICHCIVAALSWVIGIVLCPLVATLAFIVGGMFTKANPAWSPPTQLDGKRLTPPDLTRFCWWPGCDWGMKSNAELRRGSSDGFEPEVLESMDAFNRSHGYELVEFPSRTGPDGQEVAILRAWWLPPPASAGPLAPRIVVQHGMSGNFNCPRVQLAAYMLRTLGYGVLMPSVRNHGLSGKTSTDGHTTYFYEYPFDVLGAWDYVVNDPDGKLGGAVPPSRVGLMGFSMGGGIVTAAIGLEPRVPAAWSDTGLLDGPAYVRWQVLHNLGPIGYAVIGAPLAFAISLSIRSCCLARVDAWKYNPVDTLRSDAAPGRKIFVSGNAQDGLVPLVQAQNFKAGAEDPDINLGRWDVQLWNMDYECNGEVHCMGHLKDHDEYLRRLRAFWGDVFQHAAPRAPS